MANQETPESRRWWEFEDYFALEGTSPFRRPVTASLSKKVPEKAVKVSLNVNTHVRLSDNQSSTVFASRRFHTPFHPLPETTVPLP